MNTLHSSPKRAAAVAVATPCCPAPVSAITFCFPIRLARSACPRTLLILCDPVWVRSSRFSSTRTPKSSERLWHSVIGVGLPAYEASNPPSSARKSSEYHALRNSASSCSRAKTRVSGTYRPPNSPNLPRPSGAGPGGSR